MRERKDRDKEKEKEKEKTNSGKAGAAAVDSASSTGQAIITQPNALGETEERQSQLFNEADEQEFSSSQKKKAEDAVTGDMNSSAGTS